MLSQLYPLSSNALPNTFPANWKGAYILQIQALISKDRYKWSFSKFYIALSYGK